MPREVRIVIADDHAIVREGFRRVIERDATLTVVGEAADGRRTIELVTALKPEIAVVDFSMPEQNGVDVIRTLQQAGLPTRVILLTMHNDRGRFSEALDAGAAGYVLKDGAITEIVQAIHAVSGGGHYISPQLSTHLLDRRSSTAKLVQEAPGLNALTATERRILRLVGDGHTSKVIAEGLFVSIRTVEDHRANICEKLGVRGVNALLKFAMAHRFELPES
jgi:DNA-binding NarL/FixJ family response regulator